MNENIFRFLAALLLFTGMGISGYYRRKADHDSGEKISSQSRRRGYDDRYQHSEGWFSG